MDGLLSGIPAWLVLAAAFALPALEASTLLGVVLPGEAALITAGALAHSGRLALWEVILAGAAGGVVGDSVGYLFGRRFGPAVVRRLPRRVAKPETVNRAMSLVRRRGSVAVVLGRWTASLRALIPGMAGTSNMPYRSFAVANVAGGVAWAAVVSVLGYLAGAGYRSLERRLGVGELVLGALGVVLLAVLVLRARRRRAGGGGPATGLPCPDRRHERAHRRES